MAQHLRYNDADKNGDYLAGPIGNEDTHHREIRYVVTMEESVIPNDDASLGDHFDRIVAACPNMQTDYIRLNATIYRKELPAESRVLRTFGIRRTHSPVSYRSVGGRGWVARPLENRPVHG